tara:strand:+ start:231 stop:668 length:438 start_codon:yes stop_codon:yes gene_type:complete
MSEKQPYDPKANYDGEIDEEMIKRLTPAAYWDGLGCQKPRCQGSDREQEDIPQWSVWLYLCNQTYGGPEEGGWYYDSGEPVYHTSNRSRLSEGQAKRYIDTLDEVVSQLNEGRADSLVLASFKYRFRMVPDGQVVPFPQGRQQWR